MLLNGVVGYFYFTTNKAKDAEVATNATLTSDLKAITDTLTSKKAELESLKGVDAGKDSAITAQQEAIKFSS